LSAPGMPDLEVPLDGSALQPGVETVGVWKDTLEARRESEAAAQWCSDFLKTPCRLYKVDAAAARPAKPEWVDKWTAGHPDLADVFGGDHFFGFADGFPLLVANQASLDDLNARLRAKGVAPVPMDRFRPNIVVQGEWEAFEEDHTAMITTGA
ncbi:MOSC domain-containing protein, partial [Escherichia coli]